jgi:hypothetical protein
LKMRTTAALTSGPIPSPGMSVMTWDMAVQDVKTGAGR